ncbi:hypothetical protein QYF36_002043 [Acer negundo]|nr:hypothetical protein QYF36_002043 [Acer negundo]
MQEKLYLALRLGLLVDLLESNSLVAVTSINNNYPLVVGGPLVDEIHSRYVEGCTAAVLYLIKDPIFEAVSGPSEDDSFKEAAAIVGEVLAMRLKVEGLEQGQGRGIHVDVNKEVEKKGFKNRTKIWAIAELLINVLNVGDNKQRLKLPKWLPTKSAQIHCVQMSSRGFCYFNALILGERKMISDHDQIGSSTSKDRKDLAGNIF